MAQRQNVDLQTGKKGFQPHTGYYFFKSKFCLWILMQCRIMVGSKCQWLKGRMLAFSVKEGVPAPPQLVLFQKENRSLDTYARQNHCKKQVSVAQWQNANFGSGRKGFKPSTGQYFFKRKIGLQILKQCRNNLKSKYQWLYGRELASGQESRDSNPALVIFFFKRKIGLWILRQCRNNF